MEQVNCCRSVRRQLYFILLKSWSKKKSNLALSFLSESAVTHSVARTIDGVTPEKLCVGVRGPIRAKSHSVKPVDEKSPLGGIFISLRHFFKYTPRSRESLKAQLTLIPSNTVSPKINSILDLTNLYKLILMWANKIKIKTKNRNNFFETKQKTNQLNKLK